MENFLNPYDKEYMRMAILKHEETFKQQVHELHRIYRIQKLLMKNIGKERHKTQQNQELWKSKNNISFAQKTLDLERPAEDYAEVVNLIDESEIELTLGPSNYSRRRKNSKKTDTPLTSDSGPSFSSSSTGSSHNRNINTSNFSHRRLNTKKEESEGHELGLFQVPDMTLAYQNENNVDDKLRQERLKQPPWLFQVLSLNMT